MNAQEIELSRTHCAIARSLGVVGDWWSLLIVRNALLGQRRFGEFQKCLGLAKNILSDRLQKLVAAGVLKAVPAADGSAYREYMLTEKGRELEAVLAAFWRWGRAHCFDPGEQIFVPSAAQGKIFPAEKSIKGSKKSVKNRKPAAKRQRKS